jgi:hypothetical protein
MWNALGQANGTYQWKLEPSTASLPSPAPASWPKPMEREWMPVSGRKTAWPLGHDYADLDPPSSFLVASWQKAESCGMWVTMESSDGTSDEFVNDDFTAGKAILNLGRDPGRFTWTLNVVALCPWKLELSDVGPLFGPNSADVASFTWSSIQLGPRWDLVVKPMAGQALDDARAGVVTALARDSNAKAALDNGSDSVWYRGIGYVEQHRDHRIAAADAIAALVLTPVLPSALC